ncbi:unnamed protein product [Phytomonas sp. Hart1]|nr:unnamed protein product [Phytomonas sp. Hart1]|eukprot:CCW71546.1 unnamed protein product [Phytomonas sp. isolate Hart1]
MAAVKRDPSHRCRDKEAHHGNTERSDSLPHDSAVDSGTMVLTDDLLRSWIGLEDLDQVLSTKLRFDAEALMGVDRLGVKLPKLTSLKLNRSNIPHFRLLGARYLALRHLWISNCHVKDLRGIGACAPGLVELYASFNYIGDLSPLMDLAETLQVADLEGNEIAWSASLGDILYSLHNVLSLNFQGNPVENTLVEELMRSIPPHNESGEGDLLTKEEVSTTVDTIDLFSSGGGVNSFRKMILSRMPQLQLLDDIPIHDDSFWEVGALRSMGSHEGLPSPGAMRRKATNDFESALLFSEDAAARDPPDPACASDSLSDKFLKRRSHVFIDPLDTVLTEELALLQDCIRSTRFDDALDRAMEIQHRELCIRPSTSAAARTFPALSTPPNGFPHPHNASSRISGEQPRQAATSYTPKMPSRRLHEVAEGAKSLTAGSSLTTGDVFTGSAIVSLRKRLLGPRHQNSASISASKTSTEEEIPFFSPTVREVESSEGVTNEKGSDAKRVFSASSCAIFSEIGFDKDEDFFDCGSMEGEGSEHEWERLKYEELQGKCRCRPASTSASFRSRLLEYSNDEVSDTASLFCGARRLGKDFGKAAEEVSMRELLMKEVARTRMQIAREGAKSISDR